MSTRVVRSAALVGVSMLLVGACSGDDAGDAPAATAPTTTIPSAPATTMPVTVATTEPVAPPPTVTVSVDVDGAALGELESEVGVSGDPFGRFASCSGSRETFGAFSVLVSDPDGSPLTAVSVVTEDVVTAAGIHDANVRVEAQPGGQAAPANGAISASGTVTIDDGFRSGSFTAFSVDGREVSGRFDCVGGATSEPLPEPGAGEVTIEAFALLRLAESQRIVGFAAVADAAACRDGAIGVFGVDGSISGFELTSEPTLSVTVGDTDYLVDDVSVDGDASAGMFSGTVDDVSIDGAYRCS